MGVQLFFTTLDNTEDESNWWLTKSKAHQVRNEAPSPSHGIYKSFPLKFLVNFKDKKPKIEHL